MSLFNVQLRHVPTISLPAGVVFSGEVWLIGSPPIAAQAPSSSSAYSPTPQVMQDEAPSTSAHPCWLTRHAAICSWLQRSSGTGVAGSLGSLELQPEVRSPARNKKVARRIARLMEHTRSPCQLAMPSTGIPGTPRAESFAFFLSAMSAYLRSSSAMSSLNMSP